MYRQTLPPEPPQEPSNRRLWIAVFLVGAIALACAAAALAGGLMWLRSQSPANPPTQPASTDTPVPQVNITLDPTSGMLGSPVWVRGEGWVPGEVVIVFLLSPSGNVDDSLTVAVAVASDAGKIEKAFTTPKGEPWNQIGQITVLARSNRTGHEARAVFQAAPPTAAPLPTATYTPEPTATRGTPTPTPTSATPTPTRTPVVVTDWLGEYWANQNLSGDPVLQRNEIVVDFGWGTGTPGEGVPVDHFSARWSRELAFDEGAYVFHTVADDGVRLWVDQRLIIDQWHDSGAVEHTAPLYLTAGRHFVRMEYYDSADNAVAKLWWSPLTQFAGWKGEYYENRSLSGAPAVVRDDRAVEFDWGDRGPEGLLVADNFSVRWTRTMDLSDGVYQFHVVADDGVRVLVDDRLLIDEWHDSLRTQYDREISLTAGTHQLRVDYYEGGGGAAIRFWWDVAPRPTATPLPDEPTPTPTVEAQQTALALPLR